VSEQDIASLGLKVDSSQVKEADKALDSFTKSAQKAEAATVDVAKASDTAAKGVEKSTQTIVNAAGRLAGVDPRIRSTANVLANFGVGPGLLAGIGATVAALGLLVKGYIAGARESAELNRAIALTGNAAGVTAGQLNLMAERLDSVGGTRSQASHALAEFVSTGKVAAENLERFVGVAQDLERNVGVPVAQTAKQFAALADQPSKAAAELQKSFNFLTPAVYNYIRAQEKSGDVAGAAATAQKAYAGALERQTKAVAESTPLLVSAAHAVRDAWNETWDAIAGVGRSSSPEEQLLKIQAELKKASAGSHFGNNLLATGSSDAGLREEEARLKKIVQANQAEAKAKADAKRATDAYVESQEAARHAADQFADAQERINEAWRAFNVADIDRNLSKSLAKYSAFNDELEALRQANLVADSAYFAKHRKLIEQEVAAEIAALHKQNAELAKKDGLSSVERIAADNKIATNDTRIAELRIQLGSKLRVSNIQEADALKKKADALADAQDSADKYTSALIRQYQIQVQGLGLGDKERQRLTDIQAIETKFLDRRDQLTADKRRGDITEEQYRQYLKIEQNALDRSLKAYDEYYKALQAKQGSWLVGVQEGLANWADSAKDVAGQVGDAIENAMNRGIDAMVEFARTGKLNFGRLVEDILADLLRIELRVLASQALQQIFGALGSGAGGTTTPSNTPGDPGFQGPVHARASGGSVSAGTAYLVGEKGPELMVPNTSGYIVPNGGMGPTVNVNSVINMPQGVTPAELNAVLDVRDAKVKYDLTENMLRGRGAWANR
jgi:lambda family phage tail tape measure protein